jgi:hypothetical protein
MRRKRPKAYQDIMMTKPGAAPRVTAMTDEPKRLSPAQVAARIAFAWGITALVAISVYFGNLWLVGAH